MWDTTGQRASHRRGVVTIEIAQDIGLRIQEFREAAGWSQTEMAEAVGRKRKTIGRWEAGGPDVDFAALLALAGRYGIDPAIWSQGGPRPGERVNGPLTPRVPQVVVVAEQPAGYATGGRQRAMETRLGLAIQGLRGVLNDLERLSEELRGVGLAADEKALLDAGDHIPPPGEDDRGTGSG